jgi:H+/Cl- antiporter ClcA
MNSSSPNSTVGYARLGVVIVLTGLGAGLGGMMLALLLHAVQHIAYGYSLDHLVGSESFLAGVSSAQDGRRVGALATCGLIAGVGWWALYRWGRPLVSIRKAVAADGPHMPAVSTGVHALLQIVTVALGSPLGREVAPREIGALWGGALARFAGLSAYDHRVMIACGAGAGLAAVYNVPLGGAIFVLEVLIGTFEWRVVVPALLTSALAAVTAWSGLGDGHQYAVPPSMPGAALFVWSALCGPVFGLAAWGFVQLTSAARARAPKDGRLPFLVFGNFVLIGVLLIFYPQLAGNGKGLAGLTFGSDVTIPLAAALLVLKVAIEAASLRAGAAGGLLTPGLTNGALLAVVLGGLWNTAWPGTPPWEFALVGADAFLAASMQMPVTALVLIMEFTRANHDFLLPLLLSVAGSVSTFRLAARLYTGSCVSRSPLIPAPDYPALRPITRGDKQQ